MNTKVARMVVVALAVLIVGGAIVAKTLSGGGHKSSSSSTSTAPTTVPAGAIQVSVAFSPEKADFLNAAFKRFNDSHVMVDGKQVVATGETVASGAAFDMLNADAKSSNPSFKPVIWSPSGSLWGRLLTQVADVSWVPDRSTSFMRTPLVIAMWEPQARALGWPKKQLGWGDILAEARNPAGFQRFGHPEWGAFKLGHTNPSFSTSGLEAVVAEYYAATGKTEGLTEADVHDPAVRLKIKEIESSIVHYGDTTLFFETQLAKYGPGYASAVAMEETTLLDYNVHLRHGGQRLVAIYPKEGTFYSDNPLTVLNAPWVSADQKAGAQKLIDFLLSKDVQSQVGSAGFRPSDPNATPSGEVTPANGVDPSQPTRGLSLPDPKVLANIKALWQVDRKPADVVIVLDTSGSMADENKLVSAQRSLDKFLHKFSPRDRAALIAFSEQPQLLEPMETMTSSHERAFQARVDGLFPSGGTSIYDATIAAFKLLRSSAADPRHIRAAVILTDGVDNKSSSSLSDVINSISTNHGEGPSIRVFTIAYGSDADTGNLKKIADAAGGVAYVGDPKTIDSVYTSISSFF